MSRYSNDLRQKVVDYVNNGGKKLTASKLFNIARETIKSWCKLDIKNDLFKVIPRKPNCKLNTIDVINYVNQNPDKYNYEIAKEFNCSTESIRQFLKRHKISVKKKQTLYRESDPIKRSLYLKKLKRKNLKKIIYIDESGFDKFQYRKYAKSPIGKRVFGYISGLRYQRKSVISGRDYNHKLIAPIIYEGTANTKWILKWTKECLIPELKPNSTLIWDNAAIHKSPRLKEIIEKEGHKILFLPPYSPDLNPIEHKWQQIKHNLSKFYDDKINFTDNLIREVLRLTKCEVF